MTEQVNAECGQGWFFTSCPHEEDLQDCILCVCAHGDARDCGDTPISEANARLVAAAPEMLALLKRYDLLSRVNGDWIDGDEEPWSFVTDTRNLIAKLKGEN